MAEPYDIIYDGDDIEIKASNLRLDAAVNITGAARLDSTLNVTGACALSSTLGAAGVTNSSYLTLSGVERIGTIGAGLGTIANSTSIALVKFDGALTAPVNAADGRVLLIGNQGTDVNTFEGGTIAAGAANLFLCDGGTAWYSVTSA